MADNVTKVISVEIQATQAINGLAKLNAEIDKNKTSMQELARQGQKGSKEYATLEQQTKSLTKAKQDLTREVQNEIKQETQLDGSLVSLRAQLSNLTQQYDKLSRAERENVAIGGHLQKQINSVTTEIKKAEEGTQRYYRNVGNYENAILNAVGINSNFGRSLMTITQSSGGVSGAFSAMGASVRAFGQTLLGMLTNPVFLALAGIAGVGMAFKWFYDYNEGIAEANRLTKEFTGYTGDDLVAMRTSIQATSDVMGKDFKDTLQTADALMAHFHLTGEQAMEVINKGFAAGADVNGDFLQKTQQLAPTFHDAGIAADEMVAIISQTRSGIFSEQGLEAIRMGSARIREMSNTTRQALQGIGIDADAMEQKLRDGTMSTFDAVKQVSAAIKELPDNAQEVGEVMTAVFGRQGKFASQEMIESLATMSTSLDDVKAKTGEYGDLLLENISTEEELDRATAAVFDLTNKGWEEAKQKATIYAKQALVAVVKALIDCINWVRKLYNDSLAFRGAVQMVIATFQTLWDVVKYVFGRIKGAVSGLVNVFSGLATAIEGVFALDAKKIMTGWDKARNAVISGAKDFAQSTYNLGKAAVTNYANGVNDAINAQELDMIALPAFAGGLGGSASTGGGGGGSSRASGGSGGSRAKRGGGGSRGRSASGSTAQKGKTPEDEELERFKKYVQQRKALAQQLAKDAAAVEKAALQERAKESVKGINELYDAQETEIKDRFKGLGLLTKEEQEQLNKLIAENNRKRQDAIDKYNEAEKKKLRDQAKQFAQASADASADGSEIALKWRLEVLRMEMEAELAMVENNEQLKAAIRAKYEAQAYQITQEYANKTWEAEMSKYEAIAGLTGALGELMGAFGDESKEFVVLQRTLALAQILISQAVAIANAIEKATAGSITVWDMIAQIAVGVSAVTTAMVQAFTSLDSAKFASGGYIRGAGTSTSDSIPIRVSNGEAVMNAQTTAMFGGLLSSLNQLGGGVPIQATATASSVKGEEMLARAVARGVAMLPAPVVSVQDINRGQRQVEVMTERARL